MRQVLLLTEEEILYLYRLVKLQMDRNFRTVESLTDGEQIKHQVYLLSILDALGEVACQIIRRRNGEGIGENKSEKE